MRTWSPEAAVTSVRPVIISLFNCPEPIELASGITRAVSLSLLIITILFVPLGGADVKVIRLGLPEPSLPTV